MDSNCTIDAAPDRLFDDSYVRALNQHDTETEGHLISYFSRPVRVKLQMCLRSAALVEDAQQETFLRVITYFRSGKTLNNPASLPSFVRAVCHNVALEFLRAHTRYEQLGEDAAKRADGSPDPERQALTAERRQNMRRLLLNLRERDRSLLFRVSINGEDRDLVCRDLDVDRGYLRVLLHRAAQRLKAGFKPSSRRPGEAERRSARHACRAAH
jgi:RNA polymerase sigma-70 factor, ECF subfamily